MKSIFLYFLTFFFIISLAEKSFGIKRKTKKKVHKSEETRNPTKLISKASKSPVFSTPHILTASNHLRNLQYTQLRKMRVFASDAKGKMSPIPYQFDQLDEDGDYIMKDKPNAFLDDLDELTFMSGDVGEDVEPKAWPFKQPDKIYKVTLNKKEEKKAIFIGVYTQGDAPKEATSSKSYVSLDIDSGKVETNYYTYMFNKNNYLMVDDFFIKPPGNRNKQKLLSSSTFYLRLNLRYFFAVSLYHKDINSDLEAFKTGPIRSIAHVNFNYKLMAMKIDMGMYTQVVFFNNAIFLPAMLENPIDGKSLLNKDSDFYYGFAMEENPSTIKIDSNMERYPNLPKAPAKEQYWFTNVGKNYQIFLEFEPSKKMIENNIVPRYFSENKTANQLQKRPDKARPPGKSRANMLLTMDVGELPEGEHNLGLVLLVDITNDRDNLKLMREYRDWKSTLTKL